MTDNRSNEPSDEQIEAAAKALYEVSPNGGIEWDSAEFDEWMERGDYRAKARAALEAAQGAGVAPQEPCPQPCEHLSAEDAREGRDCREHPCTCPTALTSDREKLIEEARAVVPQAETPQCGPCRRGQHGYCDGNEYLRCECSHGAAPQADALPSNRENCPGNEGHAGCGEFCSMCYLTTAAPSSGVDEEKLAEVMRSTNKSFVTGKWLDETSSKRAARAVADWLRGQDR